MKVTVKQEDPPIEKMVLAKAIVKISEGFTALRASGLNEQAILVLLADRTKVSKTICAVVLSGLSGLQRDYTR